MAVKLAWFLGVVVVAALLNSLPIESKCIVQYCDDNEEMVKTLLRIQGSMERQEQQMASMKEELSLLKEEMSLLKDNLTVCLTEQRAFDCVDLWRQGYTVSGVYTVNTRGPTDDIQVYCDMETDGGGWLVFQRRQDGSVDFYRDWDSYKKGFGNVFGEFWLGNNKLHELTSQKQYTLRIDLEDFRSQTRYAVYSTFRVGPESDCYRLAIGSYTGTAGDALRAHAGHRFTTKDRDNDIYKDNCAQHCQGAWWYTDCYTSNLNGLYQGQNGHNNYLGTTWNTWLGNSYSLKKVEMKLRAIHPGM